jgi:ABC-type branched-subunit amino acid transport system substrate-binding protein
MFNKAVRSRGRALAVVMTTGALGLTACASSGGDSKAGSDEPIIVGHLTPQTGAFADVGPLLDGSTAFAAELINEKPPLGRPFEQINQDMGTIGEAQASRLLVERQGAEILWGVAHEYLSYRDWVKSTVKSKGGPLMPSVHGGAVPAEYGGTGEEPLFRGSPMDSGQAIAAVLHAKKGGAKSIAILATEIEGSQLQKKAAEQAAKAVGLDVADVIDVQPEQSSYRSSVSSLAKADADAVLMFTQAEDGGTLVKQAAEAGLSLRVIGTQEWMGKGFLDVATSGAIEQHEEVAIAAYTHADTEAWDFFKEKWNASEYAELADAENSYAMQFYDLLTVSALAIEAAGSTQAGPWAEKMREVAMGPGKKVYTYDQGIEALRAGEDIDYSGVTGEYDYNETAVVSGLFGIFEWTPKGKLQRVEVIDDGAVLKLESTA